MPKIVDEPAIFDAVMALFAAHGYDGMTTRHVAADAGVNEATLFRRYGSKAELIRRAINEQWARMPLATITTTGNVVDDLVAIVEAYQQTSRSHGAIVVALLVELARNRDLSDAFDGGMENIRQLVAVITGHQEAGRLRPEDPMTTLTALLGPLMVNEMFQRAGIGHPPARIDATDHVRAFLVGRAPGP